jgi:DNA-binding IclR family transcriptional regulator
VAAPRDGSKLAQVIELLQRADGATMIDLSQATGWLPHTTRAALTGLRKRGYAVIRERIGAGDSVYRISEAPAYLGDRTVRQRDAVDGRGPKQKATQAA